MFFIWMLQTSVFALLVGSAAAGQCPLHDVKPETVSPVMDSLQCYNDFKTHVQCTWEDEPLIHSRSAGNKSSHSSLYYKDTSENGKETLCVSLGPGVTLSNGKISHKCRYNTQRFTLSTSHTVYFKVPCVSGAKPLNVSQHGKVLAPTNLTERQADDGSGHVLSWRSPYPAFSNITQTLMYQLQYRRFGQDWIIVDNINASEYMIDKQLLWAGFSYQAKVRARGAVGIWSNWSPLVSWRTHNDGVFNLQCVIEGETEVTCSWQMKTVDSHFISYNLWCSHNDNTQASKPSECCKNPLLKSSDAGVSEFICSVTTSDSQLLTVELRPVHHSRTYKPSVNIQLPQPNPVQVKESNGVFGVSWSPPDVFDPNKCYILLQISSNKTSKIYNLTGNEGFEIPPSSLHPLTHYNAQIRLLLLDNNKYKGPPSDWSQPTVFITGPASWSIATIIYIVVGVFVGVIFIVMYNALPFCHRRIKLWNGSIPSPINSRVMEGIIKKSSSGWPYLQSEKEKTSMCVIQITDNIMNCKSSISGEPLLLHSQDVISDATDVEKGWSDGSDHAGSYVGEGMYQDKSGISFSGPYIMCCEDEIFDMSSDGCHVSETSENSGPLNGGYVVTPPTTMSATQDSTPIDSSTNKPSDEPPAYTASLDQGGIVHSHPSGYFMMPCVGMSQSELRGYVSLSQPGT